MSESIKTRLLTDLTYYAPNQLRIKPKAGVLMPFTLNRAQLYLHEQIEDQKRRTGKVRKVILKGRQQGCSTYVGARFFHRTVSRTSLLTFIFAHDAEASDSLYKMVKTFHEDCVDPGFMPEVGTTNAKELLFPGLKSGYKVGTAGTKGMGRSKTFQQVHWSEVAYSPNCDEHAAGILQTVADAPDTEIILESTANGQGNYFHRVCSLAMAGEGDFELVFIPWYWQPEYTRPVHKGFELEQKRENQDFTSEQEYYDLFKKDGLTIEHLEWRRHKIKIDFHGDVVRFMREYPFTPEEAFEASGSDTYIKAMLVRKARNTPAIDGNAPLVWGVDPARLGGDKFKVCHRKGRTVTKLDTYPAMRLDQSTTRMIQDINKYKPYKIFIDCGGLGVGLYDNLIGAGFADIVEKVDFGGSSSDENCHLMVAEMFKRAREWLEDSPVSIHLPEKEGAALQAQLSARKHDWKNNSILRIESKEEVKEELGYSPDDSDAFLLTFAKPVANPAMFKASGRGQVHTVPVDGWNPFG
jgi:hypothetical protein